MVDSEESCVDASIQGLLYLAGVSNDQSLLGEVGNSYLLCQLLIHASVLLIGTRTLFLFFPDCSIQKFLYKSPIIFFHIKRILSIILSVCLANKVSVMDSRACWAGFTPFGT